MHSQCLPGGAVERQIRGQGKELRLGRSSHSGAERQAANAMTATKWEGLTMAKLAQAPCQRKDPEGASCGP